MSTIKVDTVRPVTTDASLTLQGDSSGSGVTGITIDSAGDVTVSGAFTSQGIDDNATSNALTLDSSSNLKFNSGYGSVATAYGCRAWVNFDGTSGSGTGYSDITIRGSGNVSSITDNGTGDYTVNFTTAMPDANYNAVLSTSSESNGGWRVIMQWDQSVARTTSAIRMVSAGTDYGTAPNPTDFSYVDVNVFR